VRFAGRRLKKEVEEKTKRARRRGRDDSPKKIKRDVFLEAALDFVLTDRYWRSDGSLSSPLRNYLHDQVDILDPLLARALELELYEECERRIRDTFYPDRWNASLSGNDRMRQNDSEWATRRRYGIEIDTLITKMQQIPLSALVPEGDGNLYRAAVDFKAPPVLRMLRERLGEKNFTAALRKLVEDFRFQQVRRDDLVDIMQTVSREPLHGFFEQWFDQATFPGYRITRAEAEKLDVGNLKLVYQVTARIQNGEKGDGFVKVICHTKNDKVRRSLELDSYEEKEIRFAVKDVPKRIQVLPYFSRNRGRIMKQVTISNRVRRGPAVDTVFTVTGSSDSLAFVLDDQDEGFFTPVSEEARYLRPPLKGRSWREYINPIAYGKYYFGWRMKRAGQGDYPARWEARVPRTGDYELSFYLPVGKNWVTRRLSRSFRMNVTSAEGTYQLNLHPQESVEGWLHLGRFHFRDDKLAVVELSDAGSGYVIADAIRWEFVE